MSGHSFYLSSSDTNSSNATSSSMSSHVFVVHSQASLEMNRPPVVDNKPLARQKRKRTSPEDQAVLEAEYQRNPRPDKIQRLNIVSRVALGEKEVQIWFQNKRQSTRRKSRPLTAAEALALSSSFEDKTADENEQSGTASSTAAAADGDSIGRHEVPAGAVHQVSPNMSERERLDTESPLSTTTETAHSSFIGAATSFTSSYTPSSSQESVQTKAPGAGYLANRWNASNAKFRPNGPTDKIGHSAFSMTGALKSEGTRKRHSTVRMSTTSDGNATIVTSSGLTPSPPRAMPETEKFGLRLQRPGLARSASECTTNLNGKLQEKLAQCSTGQPTQLRRTTSGKSRDSRVWEFWCDADARNALVEKADQEQRGSAADAIEMIRLNSKATLKINTNKHNTQVTRRVSAKGLKRDFAAQKRPQLQRAATSFGRLQSTSTAAEKRPTDLQTAKKKKDTQTEQTEAIQTESDKENWEPGTQGQQAQRPRLPSGEPKRQGRRVLGENSSIMSQSSSLGALMAREGRLASDRRKVRKQAKVTEGLDPETDRELSVFMKDGSGSSGRASVSEKEELSCVQGLLSLKQGEWVG